MLPGIDYIKTVINGIKNRFEKIESKLADAIKKIDDAIIAPSIAEVGQTIVVSEIDENGKPTKWEMADTGSVETVYIWGGVGFGTTPYRIIEHTENFDQFEKERITFAEAESLYRKWMSGVVNIIAITNWALVNTGRNTFDKVISMGKEAADASGTTYNISFSINYNGQTVTSIVKYGS